MRLLALLLFPFLLAAQDNLCEVSGSVVNALTGEPIRHAQVTLRRIDTAPGATSSVATDSSGNFAATLEPGTYRISADHTGFIPAQLGARGPSKPSPPLVLTAGRKTTGQRINLYPQGVISGRIVDEDGEPVPNVDVQVSRLQYMAGRKQLSRSNSRMTNDLGEYRIFGLSPGRYYLNAVYRSDPTLAGEGQYVSTYYPRTPDPAAAAPLEIVPGSQLGNIDVTLVRIRTVTVKGRVISESGGGDIHMILSASNPLGAANENGRGAAVLPDGGFEFRNVIPGSYQLIAIQSAPGKAYSSRIPLQVGAGNIEGVVLTLHAPLNIAGEIKVEGETTENLSRTRIGLQPFDPGNIVVGPMPDLALKPDRTFLLPDLSAEHYRIVVNNLPDGFYVKSIRSAEVNVQLAGLDLTAGASSPLEIVLSPNAGALTGTVVDPRTQKPVTGGTVVLVPQDKERRTRESFYRTASTDLGGQYTFKNLIPGDYKAFCWDDVPYGSWMDPDFMTSQESRGTAISIPERTPQSLQLTLLTEQ
uniref:Cna B domain protein n=1 Tax=Solibacter usitatus (strain Ellin6076) TaxID=234267 RepID=Q01ZV9_SOLUE